MKKIIVGILVATVMIGTNINVAKAQAKKFEIKDCHQMIACEHYNCEVEDCNQCGEHKHYYEQQKNYKKSHHSTHKNKGHHH